MWRNETISTLWIFVETSVAIVECRRMCLCNFPVVIHGISIHHSQRYACMNGYCDGAARRSGIDRLHFGGVNFMSSRTIWFQPPNTTSVSLPMSRRNVIRFVSTMSIVRFYFIFFCFFFRIFACSPIEISHKSISCGWWIKRII